MMGLGLATDLAAIFKIEPAEHILLGFRPGREIPGEREAAGPGEQIKAVALVAATLGDDIGQAAQTAHAILLGEAGDLGLDRLVRLAHGDAGRSPIDEAEQHEHRDQEQREIKQRQPEGRGAKEPKQVHGDNIPRRARCAAAASQNRGRSWPAGG